MTTDEKLDLILSKFDKLEEDVSDLKGRVSDLDRKVSNLDSRVSDLESGQLKMTSVIEGTVNKCIDVLYESYTLQRDRIAEFDLEKIDKNVDIAITMAKMAYDLASNKSPVWLPDTFRWTDLLLIENSGIS